MKRLSKSGIKYLDYSWGIYSGCENWARGICQVKNCWARSITERFPAYYPNGFKPTFYPDAFLSPMSLKKPSIIGVAFMGDLFGDWIDPDTKIPVALVGINPAPQFPLREAVYSTIRCCPQHTFLFLTKCPWNLPKWSPFPSNCFIGASVTGKPNDLATALLYLKQIECGKRYISFEPLLTSVSVDLPFYESDKLNWVIIGGQTKPTIYPKDQWVREIEQACDKVGIPVFEKDNLYPAGFRQLLRQEIPDADIEREIQGSQPSSLI